MGAMKCPLWKYHPKRISRVLVKANLGGEMGQEEGKLGVLQLTA